MTHAKRAIVRIVYENIDRNPTQNNNDPEEILDLSIKQEEHLKKIAELSSSNAVLAAANLAMTSSISKLNEQIEQLRSSLNQALHPLKNSDSVESASRPISPKLIGSR